MHFYLLVVVVIMVDGGRVGADQMSPACFKNMTDYSEPCARQLAMYSSVAYVPDISAIYNWSCVACQLTPELDIITVFKGSEEGNFGYIGVQKLYPHNIILAFRGTTYEDDTSALADIEFTERRWPLSVQDSAVHHGFLQYYLSVEIQIRDALVKSFGTNPGAPVIITGHSLGGAAALIAAVSLRDIVQNPLLYTFGSPRVGNSYFAQYLHSLVDLSLYRVVHDRDIVAHLPPCSWIPWGRCEGPKYPTHSPVEIFYDRDMVTYKECSPFNGEDPTCCDHFGAVSLSVNEHLYYFGRRIGQPQAITEPGFASIA